jgi:hypothetical protein
VPDPRQPLPAHFTALGAPGGKVRYVTERVGLSSGYDTGLFQDDLGGRKPGFAGFHVWGPCPSCGHPTSGLVATKYLVPYTGTGAAMGLAAPREQAVSAPPGRMGRPPQGNGLRQVLAMQCDCTYNHPGNGGAFGCGSRWLLSVTYQPADPAAGVQFGTIAAEDAPLCWQQAEAAAASLPSDLATVQGTAVKWGGVLTSVLGVLALAGVLAGRQTIQSLPVWAQVALGVAVVVALACNVLVHWFGSVAGLGFPRFRKAQNEQELRDADLQPLADAEESVKLLGRARQSAVVSVVAAAVAVGIFLFVPPSATGMFRLVLKVRDASATTPCGTLVTGKAGGAYTFTPAGGTAATYPAAEVAQVRSC